MSSTTVSQCGQLPPRSSRQGHVGTMPKFPDYAPVKITECTHELTYVADLSKIDNGPISGLETLRAWEVSNGLVKAKAVLLGGNMVSIKDKCGHEYIWLNKEGAVNYGAGSGAFPLDRGLILHGGIRVTATTPEHGLFYDTEWDIDFESTSDSATMILSIKDTAENRASINDPFSYALYTAEGSEYPMSKYPVTNAKYVFKITLKAGEDFVRLYSGLINTQNHDISAEIWLPQTYPINEASQIISHQKKRRVKDPWVYDLMIKGNYNSIDMALDSDHGYPSLQGKTGEIVKVPSVAEGANLDYPLQWPSGAGGILYDYPFRDGPYHAVSFGDGRGAAYVSVSNSVVPHYTKMWGWGNPKMFNREEALKQNPPLAAGRPKAEYYEPWGSAFNTAFFEPTKFSPGEHGWHSFIVPIASGLDKGKNRNECMKVVDDRVNALPNVPFNHVLRSKL